MADHFDWESLPSDLFLDDQSFQDMLSQPAGAGAQVFNPYANGSTLQNSLPQVLQIGQHTLATQTGTGHVMHPLINNPMPQLPVAPSGSSQPSNLCPTVPLRQTTSKKRMTGEKYLARCKGENYDLLEEQGLMKQTLLSNEQEIQQQWENIEQVKSQVDKQTTLLDELSKQLVDLQTPPRKKAKQGETDDEIPEEKIIVLPRTSTKEEGTEGCEAITVHSTEKDHENGEGFTGEVSGCAEMPTNVEPTAVAADKAKGIDEARCVQDQTHVIWKPFQSISKDTLAPHALSIKMSDTHPTVLPVSTSATSTQIEICTAASDFGSQLVAVLDRKRAALAGVRELELTVSSHQAKLSELERVVNVERQERQQAELFAAQRLQIETDAVECFKECPEYQSKLVEYDAGAFVTCFEEVSGALTKRGVDDALPVLAQLRGPLIPSESIPSKAPGSSLSIAQALKVEVQPSAGEGVPTNDLA